MGVYRKTKFKRIRNNQKEMKHLDLFSGYGGFTIPGEKYGIETIGFSEVDKYANAVLEYNFSGIKNYGDVCKIKKEMFSEPIDIITGGSPCQDLSVAGKGAGLNGARSGLFFHFIRIIKEIQPTYFVWENVKGAFSSQRGWDFARVQIEMEQAGYDVWWQTLNAKDFGVPQNRERIFAIGVRKGSGREILFEQRESGQNLDFIGGTGHRKEWLKGGKKSRNFSQGDRVYSPSGLACSQSANGGGQGAKTGLYAIPTQLGNSKSFGNCIGEDTAFTLRASNPNGVMVKEATKKGYAIAQEGDSINFSVPNSKTRRGRVGKGVANTLQDRHGVFNGMRIRRLTPTECERLMGLKDGWTSKGIMDGKEVEISDTQRYKMCGNGVVVNCVDYIYSLLK